MMMLGLVKKLSVQSKELNVSEKEGMVMKAKWMILALLLSMFFLIGCYRQQPLGKYVSRYGVMMFKEDGCFYYVLKSKFDFYDYQNLPPDKGFYHFITNEKIEVVGADKKQLPFSIDWDSKNNSFQLIGQNLDDPEFSTYKHVEIQHISDKDLERLKKGTKPSTR